MPHYHFHVFSVNLFKLKFPLFPRSSLPAFIINYKLSSRVFKLVFKIITFISTSSPFSSVPPPVEMAKKFRVNFYRSNSFLSTQITCRMIIAANVLFRRHLVYIKNDFKSET
jgi:hypothetical protein